MSETRSPSRTRLVAVHGGGAAIVAALSLAARALAQTPGPLAVAGSVVCGLVAMLHVATLAEWYVHGTLMHSRHPLLRKVYELHHRAHHWVHYRPDTYLRDGVTYVPWDGAAERTCRTRGEELGAIGGQAAFYTLFAVPPVAAAWLLTANVAFALAGALVAAATVLLAIHLHDAVHCPGHSRLERFAWFRWLHRHHYTHHVDTGANVNFLLPLGDLLLGTLRRELTPAELAKFPTYEEACAVVHPAGGAGRLSAGAGFAPAPAR